MIELITDLARLLYVLLSAVTAGFALVIWWIIKGLASDIKGMRQELFNNIQTCSEKFRTKKEAETQWAQLNATMERAEAVAKERFEQVWKKIDNQTALFMQEKSYLNGAINQNSEKINKLEYTVSDIIKNGGIKQ